MDLQGSDTEIEHTVAFTVWICQALCKIKKQIIEIQGVSDFMNNVLTIVKDVFYSH